MWWWIGGRWLEERRWAGSGPNWFLLMVSILRRVTIETWCLSDLIRLDGNGLQATWSDLTRPDLTLSCHVMPCVVPRSMQQQSRTVTEAGWWTKWDFPLRPWWAVSVWASSTTSFSRFFSSFFVHTLLLSIFSFTHNFIFFKFFFLFSPHSLYTLLPSIFRCTHSFIFLKVFFLLALCTHTLTFGHFVVHTTSSLSTFFSPHSLYTHSYLWSFVVHTASSFSSFCFFIVFTLCTHTVILPSSTHTHTYTRAHYSLPFVHTLLPPLPLYHAGLFLFFVHTTFHLFRSCMYIWGETGRRIWVKFVSFVEFDSFPCFKSCSCVLPCGRRN